MNGEAKAAVSKTNRPTRGQATVGKAAAGCQQIPGGVNPNAKTGVSHRQPRRRDLSPELTWVDTGNGVVRSKKAPEFTRVDNGNGVRQPEQCGDQARIVELSRHRDCQHSALRAKNPCRVVPAASRGSRGSASAARRSAARRRTRR